MPKVDCIVLGGGHLITGKKARSSLLKGSEYIHNKRLGQYILETLSEQKEKIGKIIYLGDDFSDEINSDIHYVHPSASKGCIPTIHIGNEALKIVGDTQNEVVLIICSDIPLLGKSELDFILEYQPKLNHCATLFGINNNTLQEKYPDFNSAKRFLELKEQDFIFGNAFLVKKDTLNEVLKFIKELDNNGIDVKKVFSFIRKLSLRNILIACKLIIFGNIKFFDGKIPNLFKKISKPTLMDLITFIEVFIQKKGISLVNNAPSELAIDYDRISQHSFFCEKL